jgi:hypothetical protein
MTTVSRRMILVTVGTAAVPLLGIAVACSCRSRFLT